MKKIIIGRSDACDIVINDVTDRVSRKQAVLTIGFWGKMVLYDTSNNGTFINGEPLPNGKGREVTRDDIICFARMVDLDWNKIPDPYRAVKRTIVAVLVVVGLVAGALAWWYTHPKIDPPLITTDSMKINQPPIPEPEPAPQVIPAKKMIKTIAPPSQKNVTPKVEETNDIISDETVDSHGNSIKTKSNIKSDTNEKPATTKSSNTREIIL